MFLIWIFLYDLPYVSVSHEDLVPIHRIGDVLMAPLGPLKAAVGTQPFCWEAAPLFQEGILLKDQWCLNIECNFLLKISPSAEENSVVAGATNAASWLDQCWQLAAFFARLFFFECLAHIYIYIHCFWYCFIHFLIGVFQDNVSTEIGVVMSILWCGNKTDNTDQYRDELFGFVKHYFSTKLITHTHTHTSMTMNI